MLLDQAAEKLQHGLQNGYTGWQEGDTVALFGMYHLIRGITYWLAVIPFLMRLPLRVAWMLQAQHPCQQLDWLKTLLIVLAAGVLTVLVVFLDLFWGFHAFVFTSVTLALLTWRYLPVPVPEGPKSPEWLDESTSAGERHI